MSIFLYCINSIVFVLLVYLTIFLIFTVEDSIVLILIFIIFIIINILFILIFNLKVLKGKRLTLNNSNDNGNDNGNSNDHHIFILSNQLTTNTIYSQPNQSHLNQFSSDISSSSNRHQLNQNSIQPNEPPPYDMVKNELPSYEEAVKQENFHRMHQNLVLKTKNIKYKI